uniref:NDA1 n=1 Tax=Arundo donax TaxID=35708 RepID=A0A0A9CJQ3_ARUDO
MNQLTNPARDIPFDSLLCLRSTRALYLPTVAMLPRCLYTNCGPRSATVSEFACPPPAFMTWLSRRARYLPCRSAT